MNLDENWHGEPLIKSYLDFAKPAPAHVTFDLARGRMKLKKPLACVNCGNGIEWRRREVPLPPWSPIKESEEEDGLRPNSASYGDEARHLPRRKL